MKYKIADLIVEYDAKFDTTNKRSEKYKYNENKKDRDFKIIASDEISRYYR